ncbi:MAG: tRNA lysidine(34) synthetase TilS [Bacilli bacterium]|nr:tRNA lysidine(34) synthetase TilS [Bacilli bacterium]
MKLNLDKTKNYLIGVSGGPDSMALLDMSRKNELNIVVCHVNYQKRPTSNRDQKIVEDYCKKYGIKLFVSLVKEEHSGNFQNWARDYRYNFFKKIYFQEQCDYLLIAHQLDDYLETYILKRNRNVYCEELAIKKEGITYNMNVIRPLLEVLKEDLKNYCLNNKVDYGDDETNFTNSYARNVVRNEQLVYLNKQEKLEMFKEIEKQQLSQNEINKKVSEFYNKVVQDKHLLIREFMELNDEYKVLVLYKFIEKNIKINTSKLSYSRLQDIIKKIVSDKPNIFIELISRKEGLYKNYDILEIGALSQNQDFEFVLNSFQEIETKDFKVLSNGKKMEGIYVSEDDFPLIIRNYRENDVISLKSGHKKVNRIFIDKKIKLLERRKIPIVINRKNKIILISGIYRDVERKGLQSNIFVVKC